MGYPTDRVMLFDKDGTALGDLGPLEVEGRVMTLELNGTHTLEVTTPRQLEVGTRALTVDGTGKWREWVLTEPDRSRDGMRVIGTYLFVWSMQHDLMGTPGGVKWAAAEEGTNDPIPGYKALKIALEESETWGVGTCDITEEAGASLYDGSIWDYLSVLSDTWGGEFDAEIEVGATGVKSRKVAWVSRLGSDEATRRFDWGHDVEGIRRKPDPGPYYCRVVPRGGSEGTDSDGVKYSNRIGIEGVTEGGVPWIEDEETAPLFRRLSDDGTWVYPAKVVNYSLKTAGDDEELYNLAVEDMENHTRPGVTYEADVVQFGRAGLDYQGVSLGDVVHVVDRGFDEDVPLRLSGRVTKMVVDELSPETDTQLTIGNLGKSFAEEIKSLAKEGTKALTTRVDSIERGGTIVYFDELLDVLNSEINATEGWSYFVDGQGLITYDVRVSDPLVGTEATKVVQMKGGSIRIANSKRAGFSGINDWEWRSVFDADHLAAEMVVAANIVTGFIGSSGGTYINLDDDTVHLGDESDYHMTIDNDGIVLYHKTTVVGKYLSGSIQLGNASKSHMSVSADSGLEMFDKSNKSVMKLDSTSIRMGRSDKAHITVTTDSGLEMFDKSNKSVALFNDTTARVGNASKAHMTITATSGMELFDASNSSVMFAGTSGGSQLVRLGKKDSGYVNITPSQESFYLPGYTKPIFNVKINETRLVHVRHKGVGTKVATYKYRYTVYTGKPVMSGSVPNMVARCARYDQFVMFCKPGATSDGYELQFRNYMNSSGIYTGDEEDEAEAEESYLLYLSLVGVELRIKPVDGGFTVTQLTDANYNFRGEGTPFDEITFDYTAEAPDSEVSTYTGSVLTTSNFAGKMSNYWDSNGDQLYTGGMSIRDDNKIHRFKFRNGLLCQYDATTTS